MSYVLVVEDDPDSAEVLSAFLGKAGYEVGCLPDGRAALAAILARAPDLLILDLSMPRMDGPTLLEILRSYLRLRSMPVVVLTGVADSPLAEQARRMQVSTILTKGKATLYDVLAAVECELPPVS